MVLLPLVPTLLFHLKPWAAARNLGHRASQDVTQDVGIHRLCREICRGERANLFLVSLSEWPSEREVGNPRGQAKGVMAGAGLGPGDLRGDPAGQGRRKKGGHRQSPGGKVLEVFLQGEEKLEWTKHLGLLRLRGFTDHTLICKSGMAGDPASNSG